MADVRAQIAPSWSQIARYLRMGDARPDDVLATRLAPLTARVLAAARPRRAWRRVSLPLDGAASAALTRHLAGCQEAFLVCGTLGAGVDAVQRTVAAVSAADALLVHAVATAVIENWMDWISSELEAGLAPGECLTPRFSPGYGDFPLVYQRTMLAQLDASRVLGVSLTDGGLLAPTKSVTAILGVRLPPRAGL